MTESLDPKSRLFQALGKPLGIIIDSLLQIGEELDLSIYVVGGAVRDVLMSRGIKDLDISVEYNGASVVAELVSRLDAKVIDSSPFGTFKLEIDGLFLDIVSARRETYEKPGALPSVSPGTILEDLQRRDFTINAIAIRLTPDPIILFDPIGGITDIDGKLIRVLHEASFQDDATRMLRAVRYEQRLNFTLDVSTEGLLTSSYDYLNTVSGDRLRNEVELIFEEEKATEILLRASKLGLLQSCYKGISSFSSLESRFSSLEDLSWDRDHSFYYALLAYDMNDDEVSDFASRFNIPNSESELARQAVRIQNLSSSWNSQTLPSEVYNSMRGFMVRAVELVEKTTINEQGYALLNYYLFYSQHIKPELSASDLIVMGFQEGPLLGKAHRQLTDAVVDGVITTKQEQISFIMGLLG
ncbi:MAG: tRNA nucleotidyltransferase (CCA-adding enzyme) [Chloroflexi bacterium]|jgi:tRNA nucleotidyltransferase (CCA-adding enzyme)|nr:MAG: tRNA nucleotidyltransferase (CCA-adding enzyme) [Chloroflexota bacterium]